MIAELGHLGISLLRAISDSGTKFHQQILISRPIDVPTDRQHNSKKLQYIINQLEERSSMPDIIVT